MPKPSPRKKQSSSLPISPKEKSVEEKSSWKKRIDELCAFKAQNGHCNVSQSKCDTVDKPLSRWVNQQRVSYKKNALNSDRIQELNSIGFIWDTLEYAWNEHFDLLCAYKNQHGHCNVSENDTQTKSLGQWVSKQRVFYNRNTLSSD
eukprot:7605670-Ditylum_brightwellii.AAC.1